MATEPVRWVRAESAARVANGFEPAPNRYVEGMLVNMTMQRPSEGFSQSALQEAYELGRRSRR